MTRIVIAGDVKLPDDVAHGDTLKITATVFVTDTRVYAAEFAAGELELETVAIDCVGDHAYSVGVGTAGS